ncbi:MAG: zinc ribbon domain-containing protein [Proteobacteria bacterium]|nr:zinc ribbon domain-containing protein [Pseudomonadota bacterium]
MPLYDYVCDKCSEEFEVIKSSSDKEETKCPKCDEPARKLLSEFAIAGKTGSDGSCSTGGWGGG